MENKFKILKIETVSPKKLKNWSIKECEEYLEKCDKTIELIQSEKKKVEALKNNIDAEMKFLTQGNQSREEVFKGQSLKEIKRFAPSCALDPSKNHLGNHQKDTGVYLWLKGYDPIKFLGAGCYGVAWLCKKGGEQVVIKVTCDKKIGPIRINAIKAEAKIVERLEKLIDSDSEESEKAKKYLLMYTKCDKEDDKFKKSFESEFATHGDLTHYLKSKENSGSDKDNLDEIISMANQALKGLIILHSKGYSHNDIKPDNLLIVERVCKKASSMLGKSDVAGTAEASALSNSEGSGKNVSKTAMKIGDFGAMTKIKTTNNMFTNKHFCPPDVYRLKPEAVEKRDIYSLGASLLYFLLGGKNVSYHKVSKQLVSMGTQKFYEVYNLASKYKDKGKTISLLETILEMVRASYKDRISLSEAQREIKALKSKSGSR